MGAFLDKSPPIDTKAQCWGFGDHEPHLAIWRCQMNLNDHYGYYSSELSDDEIRKRFSALPDNQLEALIVLKKHIVSLGMSRFRFQACDLCITPEIQHYFTHLPYGWKEEIKTSPDYESIKYA